MPYHKRDTCINTRWRVLNQLYRSAGCLARSKVLQGVNSSPVVSSLFYNFFYIQIRAKARN